MKPCLNCPHYNSPCTSVGMKACDVGIDELKNQIDKVLEDLYNNDYYLLEHDVNEVCLSTHVWHYFKLNFTTKYPGYNIDPEYNRNGDGPKPYKNPNDDNYYNAKPDMIIHKRGCNRYNFAYFEFKGHWNNDKTQEKKDTAKLIAFTVQEHLNTVNHNSYQFIHGIKIKLYLEYADITWYTNGEGTPELNYRWNYDKSKASQEFPILP